MEQERNSTFLKLYCNYYEKLYRFALKAVHNSTIAEDLVEETFIVLLTKIDTLSAHPNVPGWLFVVLKRQISDWYRIPQSISLDDAPELHADEAVLPLPYCLPSGLTDDERQLLLWRFEDRLDYREISARSGASEAACRTRFQRAKQHCAQLMTENQRE